MASQDNVKRKPDESRWLWRVRLSAAVLVWERLWRALWPPFAISGLFVSLALLDFFSWIPGWLHALLLGLFGLATASALWRGVRRLRIPNFGAARRRLERVNRLAHRPLEALGDRIAFGGTDDPVAVALWREHQARIRAGVSNLRVGQPRPRLIRRDPLALRFALALALLVAGVAAGPEAPSRLANALSPDITTALAARQAALDAWITPPGYTNRPPVFLTRANDGQPQPQTPILVPQGSVLVAQVSDAGQAPVVAMTGKPDNDAFELTAENSYRASVPLEEAGQVAVRLSGRELGAWDIEIIPDSPPTAAFLREPGSTPLAALRIDFEAHDDYGLAGVSAIVRRPEGSAVDNETITFELPLPGLNAKDAVGAGYQDLTPHPWAGLPVEIRLVARDGRGQRGMSGAIATVLPERVFNHPVARAIIEQRKRLVGDPDGARESVATALRDLGWKTDAYDGDIIVFLSLATASHRLKYSTAPDTIAAVQQQLWDTALRLEDGELSLASRELRRLQQELMEALAGDATDEELQRLLDELEAAMNELLDAMARMQPQGMENMPADPNAMTLDREDMQSLFDRLRELAQSGARDAARQMLAELQNLLENLRAGRMSEPSQEFKEAMEMLESMQDLMRAQEELLDRTYREAQRRGQQGAQGQPQPGQQGQPRQGQQGQPGQGDSSDVVLQEALRRQLGEIMRQLGEMTGDIPRPLGRAEGAMRRSTEALRGDQPGAAVPPQTEALDQLQEGARMATEQMMQQFGGGMQAQTGMGRPGNQLGQQDPFGRRNGNNSGFNQGDVEIPSESDIQRARRILEELRRRAGERNRPPVERDYIDRLLEPY